MVIGYLECPTGIAGDMCLGALVDAGVPLEYVIEQLKKLAIQHPYQLNSKKVTRNGQRATKINIEFSYDSNTQRHLPEIEQLITTAALPPKATAWSLQVFHQLAKAEGRVHGIPPEQVHFHEVGALDAIIDIVGTCLGLDWLKIHQLHCSPMPTGSGTVKTAHGLLPVPVPAVLQLWQTRQVPIYNNNLEGELVTPTGAAIAVALADNFGTPPPMKLQTIGLGAGTQELPLPNILRLWLGETVEEENQETIVVLSTQIDDFSPQGIAYTCEQLLQEGVLDVFTQNIAMKKWRSGILLTVICYPEQVTTCETIIFRETTTLGIRRSIQSRTILEREIQEVQTIYGKIRVKVASVGKGNNKEIINVQPEYEDCAKIARQSNQSWHTINKLVIKNYERQTARE